MKDKLMKYLCIPKTSNPEIQNTKDQSHKSSISTTTFDLTLNSSKSKSSIQTAVAGANGTGRETVSQSTGQTSLEQQIADTIFDKSPNKSRSKSLLSPHPSGGGQNQTKRKSKTPKIPRSTLPTVSSQNFSTNNSVPDLNNHSRTSHSFSKSFSQSNSTFEIDTALQRDRERNSRLSGSTHSVRSSLAGTGTGNHSYRFHNIPYSNGTVGNGAVNLQINNARNNSVSLSHQSLSRPYQEQLCLRYVAQVGYHATSQDHLSFEKGEIIIIIENDTPDWWVGRLISTQQKGLVPASYWSFFLWGKLLNRIKIFFFRFFRERKNRKSETLQTYPIPINLQTRGNFFNKVSIFLSSKLQ